jgi:hypothetical protein
LLYVEEVVELGVEAMGEGGFDLCGELDGERRLGASEGEGVEVEGLLVEELEEAGEDARLGCGGDVVGPLHRLLLLGVRGKRKAARAFAVAASRGSDEMNPTERHAG